MNKIIFGVIGALVLSISGVSIVSAVGHANESKDLLSRTVTTEETTSNEAEASVNADTRLSDDFDEDEATTKTESEQSEQQEVGKRWSSESSFARGEDDDEDERESEEEDDDDDRSSRRAPVQSTTTPQSTSGTRVQTLTMQEVVAHATATSCYTTIGGSVYDLTPFIAQHPGGSSAILSLCGIDGAAAFSVQHGGQGNPATELASLKIGTLAQ
jgi:cytochrome b involved in lipid metabolism